jgi:hypothetical protein
MRISRAQALALRFGAVMLVLAAVVLAVLAITVDSGSVGSDDLTVVDDPTSFDLPDPGLFGSHVVVYGAGRTGGAGPEALGCRLLDRSGHAQSAAKMSELSVLSDPSVTVDGQDLRPLFAVRSYPSGSVVECSDAATVAPLAVSSGSTFGSAGLLVRAVAGGAAVVCLLLGVVGWFVFRPRPA